MIRKTKKVMERVQVVMERLDIYYAENDKPYLDHTSAFELLIATILSAQCTDARVNLVTPALFAKYPDPISFANAELGDVEDMIRSTGFYHNKAKNIIACCRMLVEDYGGEVPSEIEELTKLPGVGRKTANVVRGNIYGIESVVVDTHVKRISNKLGFTDSDDPVVIEQDLMKILPKEHWIRYNTQAMALGREICKAPTPKCEICFLKDVCPTYEKNK